MTSEIQRKCKYNKKLQIQQNYNDFGFYHRG